MDESPLLETFQPLESKSQRLRDLRRSKSEMQVFIILRSHTFPAFQAECCGTANVCEKFAFVDCSLRTRERYGNMTHRACETGIVGCCHVC